MNSNHENEKKNFIHAFVKANPTCFAPDLYDALDKHYPHQDRDAHRRLVYQTLPRDDRPWNRVHECPSCHMVATGLRNIQPLFGFRNMADGVRRVQSWCRECRKESAAQSYMPKGVSATRSTKAQKKAPKRMMRARRANPVRGVARNNTPFSQMHVPEIKAQYSASELRNALVSMGMPAYGNKTEMASRLYQSVRAPSN